VIGSVGLALGLAALLLGVSTGNEQGWLTPTTLALLVGGVIMLLMWGVHQLRVTRPLVDLRVSRRPRVLMTNLASVALGFALFASSIVFPQILVLSREAGGIGVSPIQAGIVLMPMGLAMLAISPVAGHLERRSGPKVLLVVGAIILALSYLLAVLIDLQVWSILLVVLLGGVGVGLGFAATPILIMQAVPAGETGAANGLNTLMRTLGTSGAAAVVAGVLANSSVKVGGISAPSPGGFQFALMLGLAAAVLCLALALLIPGPAREEHEHRSIPDVVR
jgi:MFS family permease